MTSEADRADERLLVLRAQASDAAALGELFLRVGPPLARHLRHIVKDDDLAQDLLQDAFVTVHRRIRWLNDPAAFRAWLYRIATREAIRRVRRQRARPDQAVDEASWISRAVADGATPEEQALGRQAMSAVASVSDASRAVLSLHYVEGLTLQESSAPNAGTAWPSWEPARSSASCSAPCCWPPTCPTGRTSSS